MHDSNARLALSRCFSREGVHPYDEITWRQSDVHVTNQRGETIFIQRGVEHPSFWSFSAVQTAASRFFFGDPKILGARENSIRDLMDRVVKTLRHWGESEKIFATPHDAQVFEEELTWLLIHQHGAFGGPVWLNCGLWHKRKVQEGEAPGFAYDRDAGKGVRSPAPQRHPRCASAFILGVQNDAESLVRHELALRWIFGAGAGVGTNFSALQAAVERTSDICLGGGPISEMKLCDTLAGAFRRGGKGAKVAKLDLLDVTHPDILAFIQAKERDENLRSLLKQHQLLEECEGLSSSGEVRSLANSTHAVRVTKNFMETVERDGTFQTYAALTGVPSGDLKARDVFRQMAERAWEGTLSHVQFDDRINACNPCAHSGRVCASTPFAEFHFLDDTAYPAASLRLSRFLDDQGGFDVERFRGAVRIFVLAQDLMVDHAGYPTPRVAEMSHAFRPLGLGCAEVGPLLMSLGIPYDSDLGRHFMGAVSALMTAEAYLMSSRLAAAAGPFPRYPLNRKPMGRVIERHRKLARTLAHKMRAEDPAWASCAELAAGVWDECCRHGEIHGYRNAQTTAVGAAGLVALIMDFATSGIDPDFALVKIRSTAAQRYSKEVNPCVLGALTRLGYTDRERAAIRNHVVGTGTLRSDCPVNHASLRAKGFTEQELERVEAGLANAADLSLMFDGQLDEEALRRLGVTAERAESKDFHLLRELGFTKEEIHRSKRVICGHLTVEGAPFLRPEHYKVFECTWRCGDGAQAICPLAYVGMMAAVQAWISGGIAMTIPMPKSTTVQDIEWLYLQAWKLGLKAVSIHRDKLAPASFTTLRELQQLILRGDTVEVERLIREDSTLALVKDDKRCGPFLSAVSHGHTGLARLFIAHGVDINEKETVHGTFPLLQAVCRDQREIVALLIEHGADLHLKNHEGQTALGLAEAMGRDEIAALLKRALAKNGQARGP